MATDCDVTNTWVIAIPLQTVISLHLLSSAELGFGWENSKKNLGTAGSYVDSVCGSLPSEADLSQYTGVVLGNSLVAGGALFCMRGNTEALAIFFGQ